MKKNIFFFLFVAIFSSLIVRFFPAPSISQNVPVVAAQTDVVVFEEPQAGRGPLLKEIQDAHKEILVEVYLLSDKEVIAALQQAAARGVVVRVLLEKHPFGGGNLNQNTQLELKQTGVSVEWSNPGFALTHQKTVTIDDHETFILNQNLTASSFEKNREYDVIDTNGDDVAQVAGIFNADWQRQSFTLKQSHLLVSPYNSRQALTALLQSATKTIHIEMEVITDPQIESLLIEKAKTVEVQVILPDFTKVAANESVAQRLQAASVLVRTLHSPY